MNAYTASNGIPVYEDADGGLQFVEKYQMGNLTGVSPQQATALSEFFRAKEDERLGRWRWPALPEYVAYWHPVLQRLTVTWEPEGGSTFFKRDDDLTYAGNPGKVARAYFDAHPEPKPWHHAKVGEVWLLEVSDWGGRTDAFYVGQRGEGLKPELHAVFEAIAPGYPVTYLGLHATIITAGRRIWPES